jgi:hypothetical protein
LNIQPPPGNRQQVARPQTGKQLQLLAQRAGFIGIHQRAGQRFTDANGQHRGGVGAAGDTGADGAGHQAFSDIRHGLEAGGAGATDAIGVGVHAHSGTEHNFPGDIRRFRHLHHLAKDQLLNDFAGMSLRASISPTTIFLNQRPERHEKPSPDAQTACVTL